jgi:hypothetical protein
MVHARASGHPVEAVIFLKASIGVKMRLPSTSPTVGEARTAFYRVPNPDLARQGVVRSYTAR